MFAAMDPASQGGRLVSLGVGVVALGVATYMFLTRPKVDTKIQTGTSLRFDVGPVAGGGIAGVGGKF